MIRISDAVKELVLHDGYVIEGIQKGLINLSQYAKRIQPVVEERCMKPVRLGSVVVALTRIAENISGQELAPKVRIDRFSVTSNLYEVTYERTQESISAIRSLTSKLEKTEEFFTITQGMHEITIICSEQLKDQIQSAVHISPKVLLPDLVALSVRFPDSYLEVPNTLYSLVRILALRHINVMEIISTYTELTFVLMKEEMKTAIEALEAYE